ncbi:MAG: hypothetical protein IPG21_14815 [Saprospiraceae bacterium]|nr:hypothetical protein [Candidatus Vicinibacter affinis]
MSQTRFISPANDKFLIFNTPSPPFMAIATYESSGIKNQNLRIILSPVRYEYVRMIPGLK